MTDTQHVTSTEPGDQIHKWFGLSYSNYLVLNRSHLQSMPAEFQQRMVDCLNELRAAYAHTEQAEGFKVEAAVSREIGELTDTELAGLGITEDWYDGKTPPAGLSEEDLNEWRAEHEAGSPRYFRDGSEADGDDEVLIPVPDPVPHYNRGRTFIKPAVEVS
ncbi:hypothetical protein ACWFRT_13955 [Streptomyces anulatus]